MIGAEAIREMLMAHRPRASCGDQLRDELQERRPAT